MASAGDGRFAIAWMRNVVDPRDRTSRWTPMLQIFDASGEPLTAEIEVSPASPGENDARPAVAARDDTLMVLWPVPGERRLLLGQRFEASGQPLAERFSLGEMGNGGVVAAGGIARGFVASWAGRGHSGETLTVVQKLFPTDGPVRFGVVGAGGFEPSLARDRHGNVALLWIDGKRPALACSIRTSSAKGPSSTIRRRPGARECRTPAA